ncbi:proteolipid protein 2b [Lampris incognitus]|uniref:proteolipid protein 2b n=1 Tax=Lampris incognitus TaxID=2546036 RepID=UPI0024B5161D|nr:proteolipid protein 2b [Lampris incognitus]
MADTGTGGPAPSYPQKLKAYLKTQKGSVLAAEIVLSFIVLICYLASPKGGYSAVAICEMVFAIIFFGVFSAELDKQFSVVNWVWSDLFRAVIGALLYIITSLICVIDRSRDGAIITGGVFGLIAGIVFAYDTYTIYLQIKSTRHHAAAASDDRV